MSHKHATGMLLSCIYKSLSLNKNVSFADVDKILWELNEHCDRVLGMGVMKFDLLKNSPLEKKYRAVLDQNGYMHLIEQSTGEIKDAISLVDHVPIKNIKTTGIIETGIQIIMQHSLRFPTSPLKRKLPWEYI